MAVHYLKRFRMEIDLRNVSLPECSLPEGYRWLAWRPGTAAPHASVKSVAFSNSIDKQLFPRLGTRQHCLKLMTDISRHPTFTPAATWLIEFAGNEFAGPQACGCIQGMASRNGTGAIQNVAVLPQHQNQGLGRALVVKALAGFEAQRKFRVTLEVTAANLVAVNLYRSLGFRHLSTSYRELPAASLSSWFELNSKSTSAVR